MYYDDEAKREFYHTYFLKPQTLTVLHHMARAGSITQREALMDHSVQSLTKRISEIQDGGIAVLREFKRHPVTGQRYAEYRLQHPDYVNFKRGK